MLISKNKHLIQWRHGNISSARALLEHNDFHAFLDFFRRDSRLASHPDVVDGSLLAECLHPRQKAFFEYLAPLASRNSPHLQKILGRAIYYDSRNARPLADMIRLGFHFTPADYAHGLNCAAVSHSAPWVEAILSVCGPEVDASRAIISACEGSCPDNLRSQTILPLLRAHSDPATRFKALALLSSTGCVDAVTFILSETSAGDLSQAAAAGVNLPPLHMFDPLRRCLRPQPLQIAVNHGRGDMVALLLPVLGHSHDGSIEPARQAIAHAQTMRLDVITEAINRWIRSEPKPSFPIKPLATQDAPTLPNLHHRPPSIKDNRPIFPADALPYPSSRGSAYRSRPFS